MSDKTPEHGFATHRGKSEYARKFWFEGPPCNNTSHPKIEVLIEEKMDEGWDFVCVIPGQDAVSAENVIPPQLLFRRLKVYGA